MHVLDSDRQHVWVGGGQVVRICFPGCEIFFQVMAFPFALLRSSLDSQESFTLLALLNLFSAPCGLHSPPGGLILSLHPCLTLFNSFTIPRYLWSSLILFCIANFFFRRCNLNTTSFYLIGLFVFCDLLKGRSNISDEPWRLHDLNALQDGSSAWHCYDGSVFGRASGAWNGRHVDIPGAVLVARAQGLVDRGRAVAVEPLGLARSGGGEIQQNNKIKIQIRTVDIFNEICLCPHLCVLWLRVTRCLCRLLAPRLLHRAG